MAEMRQLNLLTDPLNLDGLEPLLEQGHVEIVGQPASATGIESGVSETRLILDLMTQIELVNEMVLETSFKLERAHDSMLVMEKELLEQEVRLERMRDLDSKITELETWLEAARVENALLKRPWYKKLFNWKY
jgi:hypothetical protein